jgi:serine/threonine protein phosphatase PrpC
MTRAIGDHDQRPFVISTPDIAVIDGSQTQDEFVVVATDGFWEVFSNQTAVDSIHKVGIQQFG